MEQKARSAPSHFFGYALIFLLALSFVNAGVNAATQIFYRSGSYDGWTTGGSGEHHEASADTSGNFRAHCAGNSNAWALIHADQYYGGGTMTQITVYVTAKNAYVNLDHGPWYSYAAAEAKWWVTFFDVTTGTILDQDRSKDYTVSGGYSYYQKSFTKTVVGGHTYRVEAGVYCSTGRGWLGNWGSAEAGGTIDVMKVDGNP